jgi:arsenate reductase
LSHLSSNDDEIGGRLRMASSIRVLFVCVHNSARSRIAETYLRQLGGDRFEVTSAGYEPRAVNPLVVEALAEVGLTLPSLAPQPSALQLFGDDRRFDYVIGVCDEAHGQRCPHFAGVTRRIFWSFPDTSTLAGDHAEQLAKVRQVRDAIRDHVDAWLRTLSYDVASTDTGS